MATIHVGDGRQRRGRFGEQVAEPAYIVGQRTGSLFVRCPADTTPLHTGPLPAQLHGFDDGAIQMGDDLPAIPLAAHRRWCIRLGPGFFELPEQIVLRDAGGELADADTATGDEGVGHDHLFVGLVVGCRCHGSRQPPCGQGDNAQRQNQPSQVSGTAASTWHRPAIPKNVDVRVHNACLLMAGWQCDDCVTAPPPAATAGWGHLQAGRAARCPHRSGDSGSSPSPGFERTVRVRHVPPVSWS